ncbi:MAG TPA: single-stranded-DNA-specific exonuclease RecJ [Firmicutes bacterium]|nr:single-stranded-DNA-specific exonuclease RecJ [Bacillota bacterium]
MNKIKFRKQETDRSALRRAGQAGSVIRKEWCLYPQDAEKRAFLASKLSIPEPIAQILINRGITSAEEGELFLDPSLARLYSPFCMKDMDQAITIICRALEGGKKIAVYGDYDADGITATALLVSLLQDLGGDIIYFLPSRYAEGYGLNRAALEKLKDQGVSLIITVDCGITSVEEVFFARQMGMGIIVTDHHQPPVLLPEADAVINPLRADCPYPFKALCGAGIAYKLGEALLRQTTRDWENKREEYLDLAAIGTIADIVPLLGENRILAYQGLQKMNQGLRPGLGSLCQIAGLGDTEITARQIAFMIAPRLNAPGRLGEALPALNLLLEKEPGAAQKLAKELHNVNFRRQEIEKSVFAEACSFIDKKALDKKKFLLLAHEEWNPGVLGIVAGRMVERYNLPAILLTLEKGIATGSGRSCGGFDINGALRKCDSLLLEYGGHKQACGLKLKKEHLTLLDEELNKLANDFFPREGPVQKTHFELILDPETISPHLMESLEALEPFGYGNPRPVFAGENWSLAGFKGVGQAGQHLQLSMKAKDRLFRGISFNGRDNLPLCKLFRNINPFFSLSFDRWRGNNNLQLEVYDFFYNDEYRGRDFTIIDQRGANEKRRFLEQLLSDGEETLVFVNTVGRLKSLQKTFLGSKGIAFSHQGRYDKYSGDEKPFTNLVLYDLPLNGDRLAALCSFLLKNRQEDLFLYLLYGPRDYQENLNLLQATIPSFGSLEQVHLSLQELACGKSISWQGAFHKLKERLSLKVTRPLFQRSLEIFQEAACLQLDRETISFPERLVKDYCSFLGDLSLTATYRREREKWEKALAWQHFFLESPASKIPSFLNLPQQRG